MILKEYSFTSKNISVSWSIVTVCVRKFLLVLFLFSRFFSFYFSKNLNEFFHYCDRKNVLTDLLEGSIVIFTNHEIFAPRYLEPLIFKTATILQIKFL